MDRNYIILFIALVAAFAVFSWWLAHRKERKMKKVIRDSSFISSDDFLENWIIQDEKSGTPSGWKYKKFPGCYVILIFDEPPKGEDYTLYDDIYIGQSVNVTNRVHGHFTGKGNGDVYADLKYGRFAFVQMIPCERDDLNELERALIDAFDATESYNNTVGGGTEWSERKRGLFHKRYR